MRGDRGTGFEPVQAGEAEAFGAMMTSTPSSRMAASSSLSTLPW